METQRRFILEQLSYIGTCRDFDKNYERAKAHQVKLNTDVHSRVMNDLLDRETWVKAAESNKRRVMDSCAGWAPSTSDAICALFKYPDHH